MTTTIHVHRLQTPPKEVGSERQERNSTLVPRPPPWASRSLLMPTSIPHKNQTVYCMHVDQCGISIFTILSTQNGAMCTLEDSKSYKCTCSYMVAISTLSVPSVGGEPPTTMHDLIGWENCNKTVTSRSWHVADEIPGVGGWVVLLNSCCALVPFIHSTNCH